MFQKSSGAFQSDPVLSHHGDDVETVVGPSVQVQGDFASEGNILVKGTVSGNVKTDKLLTVEAGAKILANVKAGNASVSGQIKGNLKIDDRLEVTQTAQILGDISCKVFTVEAGALIQGKVSMKGVDIEEMKIEKRRGLGRLKSSLGSSEQEEPSDERER